MMNGIWYMAGMVNPTTTLLPAHHQKSCAITVRALPISNVVRQRKNVLFLPIISFNLPKVYTPIGPPMFKATKPKVG